MPRCRRPLARRARTRRPQLRRGPAAWSATRTSASQQNWLLMNRHNHGAPGSHSKRKQDDDKRSDFHGTPQAVNHEHERGAGRLIISRRRVVGRQSQPKKPLSTHVRQKSPVSDFLGAFGCCSSRICAGCDSLRRPRAPVNRCGLLAPVNRNRYPIAARQIKEVKPGLWMA
jgi:hypothetical protein